MRRILLGLLTLILVVAGIIYVIDYLSEPTSPLKSATLPPEPKSPPLDSTGFNPALIISNINFYQADTMNTHQIQAFLEDWGQGCRDGKEKCLKNYRVDLPAFNADDYCPWEIEAKAQATAAEIIAATARACQINPQVILVTLQKEQSLITASSNNLTKQRYDSAMGYYCLDHADCNVEYSGFVKQVYYATRQFRIYRQEPQKFGYRAGKTSGIKYGPNSGCGTATVTIANDATAALYNYTPYLPTERAKQWQTSTCDQAGNLNFYAFFKAWFGEPNGELYPHPRTTKEIFRSQK